ncbi:transcriptional regulator [Stenotrophomonas bentonitica]|uniref:transcriptional regulator n=1 Tax=Stenotrophomonas bentonitica TaxID=1450134 RepID=UPI0037D556FB
MDTIKTVIDAVPGGQAALARLLNVTPQAVNQWVTGKRPVSPRLAILIEASTGVSRHALRPDIFGAAPVAQTDRQVVAALVDSRMSKRALRAKFGFKTDVPLAKLLKLPVEQVEAWPEEQSVPALPQVLKLLGVQETPPAAEAAPSDPDADRIINVEAA